MCYLNLGNAGNLPSVGDFNNSTDWILGLPFLQAYYTLFNASSLEMSFVDASQPIHLWHKAKSSSNLVTILLIVGGTIVVIGLVWWILSVCQKAQKNRKHHTYYQPEPLLESDTIIIKETFNVPPTQSFDNTSFQTYQQPISSQNVYIQQPQFPQATNNNMFQPSNQMNQQQVYQPYQQTSY